MCECLDWTQHGLGSEGVLCVDGGDPPDPLRPQRPPEVRGVPHRARSRRQCP